jgi:hypothetical protein
MKLSSPSVLIGDPCFRRDDYFAGMTSGDSPSNFSKSLMQWTYDSLMNVGMP